MRGNRMCTRLLPEAHTMRLSFHCIPYAEGVRKNRRAPDVALRLSLPIPEQGFYIGGSYVDP